MSIGAIHGTVSIARIHDDETATILVWDEIPLPALAVLELQLRRQFGEDPISVMAPIELAIEMGTHPSVFTIEKEDT